MSLLFTRPTYNQKASPRVTNTTRPGDTRKVPKSHRPSQRTLFTFRSPSDHGSLDSDVSYPRSGFGSETKGSPPRGYGRRRTRDPHRPVSQTDLYSKSLGHPRDVSTTPDMSSLRRTPTPSGGTRPGGPTSVHDSLVKKFYTENPKIFNILKHRIDQCP